MKTVFQVPAIVLRGCVGDFLSLSFIDFVMSRFARADLERWNGHAMDVCLESGSG